MKHSGNSSDPQGGRGPATEEEWRSFLSVAGSMIYLGATAEAFLDWAAQSGRHLLPSLVAGAMDPTDVPNMMRSLGVQIWNQFPIPAHHWMPQAIKRPGRNDACWCSSGQKFKNCCERMASDVFPRLNMLRFVLDAYPASRLADLAENGHASLDAVADTAHQWIDEGQHKRVIALLEPFFAPPKALSGKLELLFDELMSALMELGKHKRREYWITEVLERGDNALKSTALQRRATMHSDKGRAEKAWADFAQAQRFNPNDPALSMLEVSLLMGEQQMKRAAERAAWWAQHFIKLRDPAYEDLIAKLQDFAHEPTRAMFGLARDMFPGVDRLATLFRNAPPPRIAHTLEIHQDASDPESDAVILMAEVTPNAALQKLEDKWCTLFAQAKPSMVAVQNTSLEVWHNADNWLDLLQREPALWNSFEVLDDLVMAVDALEMTSAIERLLVPLAERATELLRLLLDGQAAVRVPWVIFNNRHVLRPIAHLAYVCKEAGKWERFMELARWLVMELNPSDNHGLRYDLSHAFLVHGRDLDALALSKRYPQDGSPTLDMNTALAQFRTGNLTAALETLRQAKQDHPKVVTMLLKANPKPVKPDSWGVTRGGAFEAWLYVEEHQPLWEQCGALVWAAKVLKKSP